MTTNDTPQAPRPDTAAAVARATKDPRFDRRSAAKIPPAPEKAAAELRRGPAGTNPPEGGSAPLSRRRRPLGSATAFVDTLDRAIGPWRGPRLPKLHRVTFGTTGELGSIASVASTSALPMLAGGLFALMTAVFGVLLVVYGCTVVTSPDQVDFGDRGELFEFASTTLTSAGLVVCSYLGTKIFVRRAREQREEVPQVRCPDELAGDFMQTLGNLEHLPMKTTEQRTLREDLVAAYDRALTRANQPLRAVELPARVNVVRDLLDEVDSAVINAVNHAKGR